MLHGRLTGGHSGHEQCAEATCFCFLFNWKKKLVTRCFSLQCCNLDRLQSKCVFLSGLPLPNLATKPLAVALFSRWEEGDKALSRHAWLVLQESVARTERAKKTTWWPETAATADLRPDAKHSPAGVGVESAARWKGQFPHHVPLKTLLAPPGAAPSLTRVRGKHHEPP